MASMCDHTVALQDTRKRASHRWQALEGDRILPNHPIPHDSDVVPASAGAGFGPRFRACSPLSAPIGARIL